MEKKIQSFKMPVISKILTALKSINLKRNCKDMMRTSHSVLEDSSEYQPYFRQNYGCNRRLLSIHAQFNKQVSTIGVIVCPRISHALSCIAKMDFKSLWVGIRVLCRVLKKASRLSTGVGFLSSRAPVAASITRWKRSSLSHCTP